MGSRWPLGALILFVAIRLAYVGAFWWQCPSVAVQDDSYAYLLKARTLAEGWMDTAAAQPALAETIEDDPRQALRVFVRYHLSWTLGALALEGLSGQSPETVWWLMNLLGQVLLGLGLYLLFRSMKLPPVMQVAALLLSASALWVVPHTHSMAPREVAFIWSLYLFAMVFRLLDGGGGGVRFWGAWLALLVVGCTTHPRFFVFVALAAGVMGLALVMGRFRMGRDFWTAALTLLGLPAILVLLHRWGAGHGWAFLGLNSDFSSTQQESIDVLGNLLYNLPAALHYLGIILGGLSFFYLDGLLLVLVGLWSWRSVGKGFLPMLLLTVLGALALLCLRYEGYRGQYFLMVNSLVALFCLMAMASGLFRLSQIKGWPGLPIVYPLALVLFQWSLGGVTHVMERNNLPHPGEFVQRTAPLLPAGELPISHETLLYAHLLHGDLEAHPPIFLAKGEAPERGRWAYGASRFFSFRDALPLKPGDAFEVKFERPTAWSRWNVEIDGSPTLEVTLTTATGEVSLGGEASIFDQASPEILAVRFEEKGPGSSYLHRFTQQANDHQVWPTGTGFSMSHRFTRSFEPSWRTRLIYGVLGWSSEQERIDRFDTKITDAEGKVMANLHVVDSDGIHVLARILPP